MENEKLKNKYDFMIVFDVKDGNPNGDPDAGNKPRIDAETCEGIVTDVCLKRKIRNYVQMTKAGEPGYDIFVRSRSVLNDQIASAYSDLGIDLEKPPADQKDGKKRNKPGVGQGSEVVSARERMCRKFFDVRTFGAVMSTGPRAGQVLGPVQITFARSVDPVVTMEHAITRMAVTTSEDAEKQGGDNRTMGRKFTVPYGLYVAYGFISPSLANQTGFGEDDLNLLWDALANMFENDRSASRGLMSVRKLIVFRHDSMYGNSPSSALFEHVRISMKEGVSAARNFSDYEIGVDTDNIPSGVSVLFPSER